MFRNFKVEEDIETAHRKIVEQTQEVYANGDRRGEFCNHICGVCGKSQRLIDDL